MRADTRVLITAVALGAIPAAAAAQTAGGPVLRAVAATPTVAVKAWNPAGSIRFVAWDHDSVVVRGTLDSRMALAFGGRGGALKIVAERRGGGEPQSCDLVVYVPRRAMVSVKTVSADIAAEGASGWFYTVSGNLRLTGEATSIEAESMTGSLDLDVATPWVRARTGSGHLLLRGTPQDADVATISGVLSIAASSVLRGQFGSVSGDIHYAATPAPRSIVEFSNHSGSVDLLLPADVSASLTLTSSEGAIANGFTNARPASASLHAMRITLGGGQAQVTVRTFRGTIRLRPR